MCTRHTSSAGRRAALTDLHTPSQAGSGPRSAGLRGQVDRGSQPGTVTLPRPHVLVMGWEWGGGSPGLWLFYGFPQLSESTVLFLPPVSFPLSCWNFLGMAQCSLGEEEGGVGFCPAGILEMSLSFRPPLCWPLCSRFQQLHGVCLSLGSCPPFLEEACPTVAPHSPPAFSLLSC